MQLHCSASADPGLGSGVGRKQNAKHPTLLLACFLLGRDHTPPNSQMLQRLGTSCSEKLLNCAVELNVTVPCPSVNSKGVESSAPSPEQGSCILFEAARQLGLDVLGYVQGRKCQKRWHF